MTWANCKSLVRVFANRQAFASMQQLVFAQALPLSLAYAPPMGRQALERQLLDESKNGGESFALWLGDGDLHWLSAKGGELLGMALAWQKLQQRVVKAGRKAELLLQAIKLTQGMTVLDAMAGLGHDGLLLASTGARVLLLEKHPVMALLLFFEYQKMLALPNWQGLLANIELRFGDFLHFLFCANGAAFANGEKAADRIYLDPMFPAASYRGKVAQGMQLLHRAIAPPKASDELLLWTQGKAMLKTGGRLIVKRPKGGAFFAQQMPAYSTSNDAIRFDVYL